jgi:hypothetical protein
VLARELGTEPGLELAAMVDRPAQRHQPAIGPRYLASVPT